MSRIVAALSMIVLLCLTSFVGAQHGVKVYPGATLDQKATDEANKLAESVRKNVRGWIYVTRDPFDKVVAFYRRLGKEDEFPWSEVLPPLPSGQRIKKTIVILDGARDLESSRLWVNIQHPFIGGTSPQGPSPQFQDIRDVTAIEIVQGK